MICQLHDDILLHKAIFIYINLFFDKEEFFESFSKCLITWFISLEYIIIKEIFAIKLRIYTIMQKIFTSCTLILYDEKNLRLRIKR